MKEHYHHIEELFERDANFVYLLERGNRKELCIYRAKILAEQNKRNGCESIEFQIEKAKKSAKNTIIITVLFLAAYLVNSAMPYIYNISMPEMVNTILLMLVLFGSCGVGVKYGEITYLKNIKDQKGLSDDIGKQVLIDMSMLSNSPSDEELWQEQIIKDSDEILASKKEALDEALDLDYRG